MKKLTQQYAHELVRLVIAGSVDDGKSTMIGRLLYDAGELYEDQVAAVEQLTDGQEGSAIDFSLFTDGLAAEREQKITIDVAYRYFSTDRRRFIVADVPGHEQYTRNMVTGASQADIALILVDARKGLLEQSKRHLFIASLLGIAHIAIVVNKLDMKDYSQQVFDDIVAEVNLFVQKLHIKDIQFIPISALHGDMIVERGNNLDWYQGRTVYDYVNHTQVSADRNLIDFRFPVQYVLRPHQDFRGYAGVVESGVIRTGDKVAVMPSGQQATVASVFVGDEQTDCAFAPQSAVVSFDKELDVSRGEMIVREKNLPMVSTQYEVMLCWFDTEPMRPDFRYRIKHTTQEVGGMITGIEYCIDMDTLHRQDATGLAFNEIGRVRLETVRPLIADPYRLNRYTGSLIIIDEKTKRTVGAGIILSKGQWQAHNNLRAQVSATAGKVLWFTGLSGAGKSSLAEAVAARLKERGDAVELLDGDVLRSGITSNLDYSPEARKQNVAIAGFLAERLAAHGVHVVASFISPYKEQRASLKQRMDSFVEIYVSTPQAVCEARDVKGLYKKARAGEIVDFTGIDAPYEAPDNPDIVVDTSDQTLEASVDHIFSYLDANA